MRICFLFVVSVFFCFEKGVAQATNPDDKQEGIVGNVVDSASGLPVEYATITLVNEGNKAASNGTVTDSAGRFSISGIKNGIYTLTFEFIGYDKRSVSHLTVSKKNQPLRFKNIALYKNQVTLQGVTVTSQKGLIENRIDKMVFNAEKDLTSQGGMATDVLKKVPQVSVDVDGNVELAGSSGIRFLINGKPSSAFGSSIADVLQSIPASQIKSIEVITNPGAKYDAQGLGGIINIILKQSKVKGINGNLSVNAGSRFENGSLNMNVRKGNFGMNAFVSANARLPSDNHSSSERLSQDVAGQKSILLSQQGTNRFRRHGQEAGLGFDWTLNKKNNFTASINYDAFGNTSRGMVNQQQSITDQSGGNVAIPEINTITRSNYNFLFSTIDASAGYKRTFDQEDRELEVNYNATFGKNRVRADNNQVWLPEDSVFYGINSLNTGHENGNQLSIDYTQPLKKNIMLGTGGKYNYTEITSNAGVSSFQPVTGDYFFDKGLSNSLNYKQKIFALYTELSFPVAKLFDAKLGMRYERTDINAFFSNAQQQSAVPGYDTWAPSVFFSKKIGDYQIIKLNYSRRIERPDYGDLNPFVNTTDPKNISAGNPFLRPQKGNRVELGYTRNFEKSGSFMVTAFYRGSEDDIQPYVVFYPSFKVGDSVYNNVSVSTRENIGTERNFGMSFFIDLHITTKFTVRGNLFMFKRHTINSIDPGYNSNSFNYRTNINAAYQFPHDLAAEFFGNFNSPRNEAQGRYPSFTTYNFAARKQLMHKKASIALTAVNPFTPYMNQRTQLYGPNFTVNSLRKIPFRAFGINFTWKFGKLEFKKEKEEKEGNTGAEG